MKENLCSFFHFRKVNFIIYSLFFVFSFPLAGWAIKSKELLFISKINSSKSFSVFSFENKLLKNQSYSIQSADLNTIIGLAKVVDVQKTLTNEFENIFLITQVFDNSIIQIGDNLTLLSLSTDNEDYPGSTNLLVKSNQKNISSKYKPLFTQGLLTGETAQTLNKDEFLINYLGQVYYGFYDNFTLGTATPVNAAGGLNFSSKFQIISNEKNSIGMGLYFTRIPQSSQSTVNLTFLWDSYNNDSMITHNFLSLAVLSYDKANETTAIKSFGSSSIQSGYEFILKKWDRILIGPNYNFEKKSIGGYLTYVQIWDRLHLHLSINTIDIRATQWSYSDGYYAFLDMYWRY